MYMYNYPDKHFIEPFAFELHLSLSTAVCLMYQHVKFNSSSFYFQNDMETCRERLLTVKGVISITFDLSKNRSIIRVKPEITASVSGPSSYVCTFIYHRHIKMLMVYN